ncbi:MAG: hypothetical protein C0507_05050 [Cyanobacteria bacterium PR.3.49]|nr:hypothetical protein [Cyanobacteria bacterium PR.3.49]
MKIKLMPTSNFGGKSSLQLLAARLCVWALSLAIFFSAFCLSAPRTLAATQDLNSLETRFFEHTYPQETMEDRLTRLEKMVFGEARTGDNQERLQALVNAVPPQTAPSTGTATAQGGQQTSAQNGSGTGQNSNDPDDSDTSSGTDYPRVTELEKVILGKSYQGEPIKHRLDQLELKVFGKSHAGEDLADRVDRIAQYADKKYNSPQAFAQSEPRNGSIEQKVAWLETQIEGQSFPQKPMIERLRPLEQAMFPTDPTDIHASIPEQVNMLMSAVELLHKQQAGRAGADQEVNIAPLIQNPQQRTAYARQNNYGSDLQKEFQSDDGSAPAATPNYSPNYRPQQAYGSPSYTQSQGQQYAQPSYSQQAPQPASSNAHHGHPFFRGLAKALGEVGSMVGSSVMQGGMMNFGSGSAYGGYGMPGAYGMGNGGAVFGFP